MCEYPGRNWGFAPGIPLPGEKAVLETIGWRADEVVGPCSNAVASLKKFLLSRKRPALCPMRSPVPLLHMSAN